MTEKDDPSPNQFESGKPGTRRRTEAEEKIASIRAAGGIFVEAVARTRMPMAVADTRLPGTPIVFANQAFLELSGYSMEEVLGQQPHFLNGPDTDPEDAEILSRALARGDDILIESVQYRKNGSRFCAALFSSPVLDERGEVTNQFLSYLDITRRTDAENALRARLRDIEQQAAKGDRALQASEQRFRLIVESARDYAIFVTDPAGLIVGWFPGAEAVFGWTAEQAIGRPSAITFTPEDRAAGEPEKEIAVARAEGSAPDVRWHVRKDGTRVFIQGTVRPLADPDGRPAGFLKIGQDVTERRRADEHQAILLAELQHRVRNTLAVVRSIARRTSANSETVEDFASHFEGRLDAFARVQAMVTRAPGAAVDLAAIVEDELLVHAAREGDRLEISGPDIALNAKAAETLSLMFHELSTNAVKYGALQNERGRLAVRWELRDAALHLTWEESGLSDGVETPEREGFGMELLQRAVPYELGGETHVCFRPEGLLFTLIAPADRVVARNG